MRVFEVREPQGTYFAEEFPDSKELDEIVISSNAYVLETDSPGFKEFCQYAQKYLTRVTESYIGGPATETPFYKRVRIDNKIYLKVPSFFPKLCHFTAKKVVDMRKKPDFQADRFQVRTGFELYDYQEQVETHILPQLQNKPFYSGILHAVCGAGKTGMTCYLMAQLGVRTVIFVNTDHLLNQWVGELKAWLGLDEVDDIGYISGKHKPPNKVYPVMICMLQSIRKGSSAENLVKEYIQHYDLLVSDECHHMAADTYYETVSYFKGRHRLALSATLERSDNMIRLVPYLFGPVACRVVEDLVKSTYVKYLHPLYYTNPAHADRLYLPQWRPSAKPKLNYGLMTSRVGDDLNRIRLAMQYNLATFPGQRILFLAKLRCQAEYAAAYLQYREHVVFCYHVLKECLGLHFTRRAWWQLMKMSHHIQDVEEQAHGRVAEREASNKKKKKNKRKSQEEPKKPKKPRKKKPDPDESTGVFLYMGGGASSRKKREYRDQMLEKATYLSCTAAIAGEAFNIRGVNALCILSAQKPNGLLEQFEGRVKRGRNVDRVDVVTLLDMGNPTFAQTGRKQIRWFRKQRYLVHKPHELHVDMETCPESDYQLDSKSIKAQKEWELAKRKALETGTQMTLEQAGFQLKEEEDSEEEEAEQQPRQSNLTQLMNFAK